MVKAAAFVQNKLFTESGHILLCSHKNKIYLKSDILMAVTMKTYKLYGIKSQKPIFYQSKIICISVTKLMLLSLGNVEPGRMACKVSVTHTTKISQKGKWQHKGKVPVVNKSNTL
jgi:hypothetical protein